MRHATSHTPTGESGVQVVLWDGYLSSTRDKSRVGFFAVISMQQGFCGMRVVREKGGRRGGAMVVVCMRVVVVVGSRI